VTRICVTSSSFSSNSRLRERLLKSFNNVIFNDRGGRLTPEEVIDCLVGSDGAIVGLESINRKMIERCNDLKIIAKYGVGLDNLDLHALSEHNVSVGWTPGTNKRSVAEMVVGFMICLKRNLYQTSQQLKRREWNKSGGEQLSGKRVGIIGVGNTGKEVVTLLKPFRCQILGNDIEIDKEFFKKHGVKEASKEKIFESCDLISLHLPLTNETRNLISDSTLSLMSKTTILINCSRGEIVKQVDLKSALLQKKIFAAAIDVYEDEPPSDHEFLSLDNLFCTPHIGGNAREAVEAMGFAAIEHLENYFDR
jgi:phosphoglycerate dehydrogenase-like enzyme